jgi:hypothetical protein
MLGQINAATSALSIRWKQPKNMSAKFNISKGIKRFRVPGLEFCVKELETPNPEPGTVIHG